MDLSWLYCAMSCPLPNGTILGDGYPKRLEDPAGLDFLPSFDGLKIVEGKIDHDAVLVNVNAMDTDIGEDPGLNIDIPYCFCIHVFVRTT